MGLRTVMAWRPAEVGRRLIEESGGDPWRRWKDPDEDPRPPA
jgi:hypothetical protein